MKTCNYCKQENPDSGSVCLECGMALNPDPTPDNPQNDIPPLEKVSTLNHEVEAERLDAELTARGIPHVMVTYNDSAFDGLFQTSRGWGHVEAPEEHRDTILEMLDTIRQPSSEPELSGAPELSGPIPNGGTLSSPMAAPQ